MTELAFWIAFGMVAYTFAGYPLLLAALARLFARDLPRASALPHATVLVVVHNGAAAVEAKLRSILAQDYPRGRLSVLVVSDGSDDGTERIARAIGDPRVEVLACPERRGKAACLNDGVAACRTELVVFTDVRQPLDAMAVRRLAENFGAAGVAAASGELVFVKEGMTGFGEALDAYWRYEKFIRSRESALHSTVGVTGALYAMRREHFRPIPGDTILDDVLIPMNAVARGGRVVFERGALAFDVPSKDAAQERRRKVRTLAGNFQLLARRPDLLLPWRNPIAFQFVSHKVMRLLAPVALALLLLGSAALAPTSPLHAAFLAVQLAGYALAAASPLWRDRPAPRLVRLAAGFVSLNWFVVLGFLEFLGNRRAHLWKSA